MLCSYIQIEDNTYDYNIHITTYMIFQLEKTMECSKTSLVFIGIAHCTMQILKWIKYYLVQFTGSTYVQQYNGVLKFDER